MRIFRALKAKIGEKELYVLADTSYGSCCVDEVAAQHVDANAVVHYGHACMSQTSRLPVKYVFGKKPIVIPHCVHQLASVFASGNHDDRPTIVLKSDVSYAHASAQVAEQLRQASGLEGHTIIHEAICTNPSRTLLETSVGPSSAPSSEEAPTSDAAPPVVILYVGPESVTLTNLLMINSTCTIYSYSPISRTARLESPQANRILMKRYATVQKARDSDVFGILVGTLGVASYLPLISHLRSILTNAKKKFYTVSVGKLNPAKLANFMEIDCWILVACPEGSLVDNSKDFFKPIVTPYELHLALAKEGQGWTGKYILDFEKVLSAITSEGVSEDQPGDGSDHEDEDRPHFSLVTGKYRQAKKYGDEELAASENGTPGAVVLRNKDGSLISNSAAAMYLQNERTYKGLETRTGQDEPGVLEQGRSGIAWTYGEADEPC